MATRVPPRLRMPAAALLVGLLAATFWPASARADQKTRQALLQRVFGKAAVLDAKLVAKVKAMPPGKRLLIDSNHDGTRDECWYIDTAPRHTLRPLLVRAIDEDGDLGADGAPDLDSDLYLFDWRADGTVDTAIDYQDNDGDQDVDEMAMYYFTGRGKNTLMCWHGTDVGDDNLLWYDVNGTYSQRLCQYRSHFSGSEAFCAYTLTLDAKRWQSRFENPFVFYDIDGDGATEVVARFEGLNDEFTSLRYSFDADGDAGPTRPYDYEFSITAISSRHPWLAGKGAKGPAVVLNDKVAKAGSLRGIPTPRVLRWDAARDFAEKALWARACLTWDELNANTEGNWQRDPHERWEGLITAKSRNFPQIGGPPCSRFNKRFEVSLKPARPLALYHDPTDHRLHLLGATEGWLDVDYDLDGKVDARVTWTDLDSDGRFDRRRIDLDADGNVEFDWPMAGKAARKVPLDQPRLCALYRRELAMVLASSQEFIDGASAVLGADRRDAVAEFFLTKLPQWCPSTRLGLRVRRTPAGARFYMDLVRDRLFYALGKKYAGHRRWAKLEGLYAAGCYGAAAKAVRDLQPDVAPKNPLRFGGFTRLVPIRIGNYTGKPLESCPVVVRLSAVKAVAPDFNPANCAVVAPERWIDWRELPHQIDDIDPAGKELSFLADLPAGGPQVFALYYSPAGTRKHPFPAKTAAAKNAGGLCWESVRSAYRVRVGRFDFLGKSRYEHSRRAETLLLVEGPKPAETGHAAPVFVEALSAGNTAGLGGLTVRIGDRTIPLYGPEAKTHAKLAERVLVAGPIRSAVETTATTAKGETFRVIGILYADGRAAEIRVLADGPRTGRRLAIGLVKLARERTFFDKKLGCLGAWGRQNPTVGQVGLGVIVPPKKLQGLHAAPHERRLRCDFSAGRLTYWIVGDWRRGRRFPIAPTIDNWRRELTDLSRQLQGDVRLDLGPAETVPAKAR